MKGKNMRSIYTCPHCGKKAFGPLTKAFAGQMNSHGKPCENCGKLCVNGKGATWFNAIYTLICFAAVIIIYLNAPKFEWLNSYEAVIVTGIIASYFIIPKLVNSVFFKLHESIRLNY